MKITGIILILVGLVAGTICFMQLGEYTPPDRGTVAEGADKGRTPNMTLPLTVCGAAVVIGGLMVAFGGRGYFISNNPRVRN